MPETNAASVYVERRDEIAIVVLNAPARRNALPESGRSLLLEELQGLSMDSSVRAIVLTGAAGHFCAGADVSNMQVRRKTFVEMRHVIGIHTHPIVKLLYGGPKPCVSAVEGICFGMGMSLAVACDYIVTASNARYCVAQLRVGLTPDIGIMWTLPRRIGEGRARELMLLAKEIDAETALGWGVANELVEPGETLETAIGVARQLASMPPVSMSLVRSALAFSCNSLDETLKSEIQIQPVLQRTADQKEAVKAFVEKRKPVFIGE